MTSRATQGTAMAAAPNANPDATFPADALPRASPT